MSDELLERADLIRRVLAARAARDALKFAQSSTWLKEARPEQLPPPGDWSVWAVVSGRGWGKTRAGSEWIAGQALQLPGTVWAVVGATWRDTQDVPLKAIKTALEGTDYKYNASDLHFYLPNGSEIIGYSADRPDRLRGANLSGAWCDELCHFSRASALWYEALVPAVRIGRTPRILVTTTPRPTPLIKDILGRDDGSVVVVRGSTWDNAANLSPIALEELRRRYEGTRIGRQELYGELLMDAEHALWSRDLVEAAESRGSTPELLRTIVAVDPSGSATGDATGIITAGVDRDGVIYVLADDTCQGNPEFRYEQICKAAVRAEAGTIVYEGAYGGDNIAHGIRSAWSHLRTTENVEALMPMLKVSPTKSSKADRAHPVVALYEQTAGGVKKIVHARPLPELEDEMVQWEPSSSWSPNRIDALVHAVRFLAGAGLAPARISSMIGAPSFPAIPIG